MITAQDVQHLADLARIEVTDSDIETLKDNLSSILAYVGQIQNATGELAPFIPTLHNVMREDIPQNTAEQYTNAILANAPDVDGRYIRVKKIL